MVVVVVAAVVVMVLIVQTRRCPAQCQRRRLHRRLLQAEPATGRHHLLLLHGRVVGVPAGEEMLTVVLLAVLLSAVASGIAATNSREGETVMIVIDLKRRAQSLISMSSSINITRSYGSSRLR